MIAWRVAHRDQTRPAADVDSIMDRLAGSYHVAREAFAARGSAALQASGR